MIFINMQTLNTKLRLLCASTLTALTLTACQQAPVVAPAPAPLPVPIALIPPVPQPVIIEDPLVVQIKALDRPNIEGRINLIGQYARHYPAHFDTVRARHAAEAEVKDLLNTVNPIAKDPKATHNELVQAFKVNGMARNLDVGSNTTTNADNFIRRALKLEPKNPETNYWFGVLLTEGGGMKEGIPYLNKAAKSNFNEAHLSLANAYLGLGKNDLAIAELRTYQKLVPTDTRVPDMLDAVKQNKAAIW
jgi:tetratricopeptide (TPR) repeat protein